MTKRMRHFENAVDRNVPGMFDNADLDPQQCAVANAAAECDSLQRRLSDNAQSLAERLAKFSRDVACGLNATSPLSTSTTRDIETDVVRYAEKREQLFTLVRALYGADVVRAVKSAIEESFAAVEVAS